MAEVYNRLYIEINEEVTDIITAVQNDANSRFLDVTLLDNGQPINLTGEDVKIYMKKPDGTEIFNNGTVTDAVNGRCQFELTTQALGAVGVLETQISIWQGATTILSTQVFNIYVTTSLISESSVESSNEYGALVVLFQNIYEAYDLMTEMVQKIGVPGPNAQELNLDTMFEVWDYMIDYLKSNSVAGIVENVTKILTTLGVTTDIGGTDNTGSVMAKLNALLKGYSIKSIQWVYVINSEQNVSDNVVGASGVDCTISAVNVDKTFLIANNVGTSSSGTTAARLINSTTVRVFATYQGYVQRCIVQVIEFY